MSYSQLIMNVTGIDTETIIQELMKVEQRSVVLLQNRQKQVSDRQAAWDAIKTKLDSLTRQIKILLSEDEYYRKTAQVSDATIASVSVSSSAALGTYDLEIVSLATSQVVSSKGFSSSSQALNISGTATLNGKTLVVEASDTLDSIAAKINSLGAGASASVLKVSDTEYRLVLTASSTGKSGTMQFGGDVNVWNGLGTVEVRPAQDAVFYVNGVQFTRSSNTVTDVINGVTIELLRGRDPTTGQNARARFTINYDDDTIVKDLKAFVTEYNGLIDLANKYASWDPNSKTAGTLFGDPTLMRLLREIREYIMREVQNAVPGFTFVGQVGLSTGPVGSFSRDGKLSLDETKLKSALQSNRDAVAVLLGAKPPSNLTEKIGVLYKLSNVLDAYTQSGGYLAVKKEQMQAESRALSKQIEEKQRSLDLKLESLKRQFAALERTLAQLNAQGTWMAQQISYLSGFNRKN